MSHFHLEAILQNFTNASLNQHNKQATNTFTAISVENQHNTATEIQITVATKLRELVSMRLCTGITGNYNRSV